MARLRSSRRISRRVGSLRAWKTAFIVYFGISLTTEIVRGRTDGVNKVPNVSQFPDLSPKTTTVGGVSDADYGLHRSRYAPQIFPPSTQHSWPLAHYSSHEQDLLASPTAFRRV